LRLARDEYRPAYGQSPHALGCRAQ